MINCYANSQPQIAVNPDVPCIALLANCRSQKPPTDSADEPKYYYGPLMICCKLETKPMEAHGWEVAMPPGAGGPRKGYSASFLAPALGPTGLGVNAALRASNEMLVAARAGRTSTASILRPDTTAALARRHSAGQRLWRQ